MNCSLHPTYKAERKPTTQKDCDCHKIWKLKELQDPNLEQYVGWVSPQGDYYPCDPVGHMDLQDRIQDLGLDSELSYDEWETKWVKIAMGDMNGECLILTSAKKLTARQKVTLTNLILKYDLIENGDYHLTFNMKIERDGKQVHFRTLK